MSSDDTPNQPESEVTAENSHDHVYDPLNDKPMEFEVEDKYSEKKEYTKPTASKKELDLPHQNVSIDLNPIREGTHKGETPISIASDTFPAVDQAIFDMPAVNLDGQQKWSENIEEGVQTEVYNGTGYERFAQPDGLFTNLVKTDQGLALNGVYAATQKTSNNTLTGERAVLAVMNHMKVGNIYMSPLWNSGFWISVKPPTESALIDLMHIIRSDKVRIGRATYGMVYSAISSVTSKHVIDFIKAHIYTTSINSKEFALEDIDKYISMNDLDSVILAIISAMYPSGFNFSRSCVADPLVCNHVTEAILDPDKLLYVNRRALTDSMLGHMSHRRPNSMSMKDVESYQTQLASRNIRSMTYTSDGRSIHFELKSPNLRRYAESSGSWISDIEITVDRILQKEATDQTRDTLIKDHARATAMRQYSHYVDSITFGDNNVIQDTESIFKVLSALSADNSLAEDFNKNVVSLINSSSIANTGIPTFNCPNCEKPVLSRANKDPAYRNLIPLDLLSIFFSLVRVKMAKIALR